MEPAYVSLIETGEFRTRVDRLYEAMQPCSLCPRGCGAKRLDGETGFCRTGMRPIVASYAPHFGEEAPLVGTHGSGTIFLSNCNLDCIFCQNYDISHRGVGREVTTDQLARMMRDLQDLGCHNINLVTPTHVAPQLVEALGIAAGRGLRLPIVWNCGGYESIAVLRELEGIVDIYMPDAKYGDEAIAQKLSGVKGYPRAMKQAVSEMHHQVGDLQLDARGIAQRGLLVRHLVLPEDLAGTQGIMEFLAGLSENTYVNVMAQYRPCYQALEDDDISRPLTAAEYEQAVGAARKAGLRRFDLPDFFQ